jgi:hypothetical protein
MDMNLTKKEILEILDHILVDYEMENTRETISFRGKEADIRDLIAYFYDEVVEMVELRFSA